MNEFIKKLKAKPEAERERVAKTASLVFTVLVGFVFLYSFGARISENTPKQENTNTVKPFQLLKNSISETYDGITASVGNAKSLNNARKANNDSIEEQRMIPLVVVDQQ